MRVFKLNNKVAEEGYENIIEDSITGKNCSTIKNNKHKPFTV
jgi:hypothetical protein